MRVSPGKCFSAGTDVRQLTCAYPAGGLNDAGMPLQDTIDTFSYLLREANALRLAYVALVRYLPRMDLEIDGAPRSPRPYTCSSTHPGKKRATKHDVLGTYKPLLSTVPVFVNAGVTPAEAEALIDAGTVAGAFFGVPWITHPDLGRRLKAGKALDNALDYVRLYGVPGVEPALGYTDYKEAWIENERNPFD